MNGLAAGVDPSDVMVGQPIQRNRSSVAQGRVDLRQGGVTPLPFSEAYFWPSIDLGLKGAVSHGAAGRPRSPGSHRTARQPCAAADLWDLSAQDAQGKFIIWSELLADLPLRGDEHALDMGCGRAAVMAMVAKLVPQGRVVALDLWTGDQSGNPPETTWRNLNAETSPTAANYGPATYWPCRFQMPVSTLWSAALPSTTSMSATCATIVEGSGPRSRTVLKPGGRLLIADF
jgi:hypothetical protein